MAAHTRFPPHLKPELSVLVLLMRIEGTRGRGRLTCAPEMACRKGQVLMRALWSGLARTSYGPQVAFGGLRVMRLGLPVAFVLLVLSSWGKSASSQDARRGEHVFRKCLLCHVVEPGTTTSIAPPLHDIIGRRAGSVNGFQYSEIMQLARDKGLTWSEDALFQFLDKPEDFMPGTYMAFAGLDEQERRDVIAFLKQLTERNRLKPQGGIAKPGPKEPALAAQPQRPVVEAEPSSPAYVPNVPPTMLQSKPATTRRPERQPERPKRPPQSANVPQ